MDIAEELIGRARELQPVIAARAAATEQNRAPLDETIRDLSDAGLFKMLSPKRFGGYELHVDTMTEVCRLIAAACPSTGWVTSFYIGHNWLHAVFPEKSQEEAFAAGPFVLSSGQVAPTAKGKRVAGGFEISGRQGWSSGVAHADWVFFTGIVTAEGEAPHPYMFCVPRAQVEVIDTWHIAGMQGTGSRDVAVDGLFVPDHQAVSFIQLMDGSHPGAQIHANPLYKLPVTTALSFEVMPVIAGALRGAADTFSTIISSRVQSYTGQSYAEKPAAQMRAGRAYALADALDSLARDAARNVVSIDRHLEPIERAQLRMLSSYMTKLACDGVNDIMHGAGGDSFRNGCSLQRYFRDLNVLRTHGGLDIEPTSELYGKVKMGVDIGQIML
ncbi:acyl-CoA dehydrogenase [Sphingobium phenoxybenzoativorans]|uniref:Acyl-CoA dehydrogenase n=1 Tax=Sphingobium phenoxybenzoativorans TaxID=1592790 RepID=A0A975K6N9_9SPHN|nr:acyl-CoA dehydrogenase family protein [Sphingobium phenoxybenzoativorans]QUT05765.1 acyl-CoA dehydrogenase [Sphingobium phenoxybenzoativorans]